MIRLDGVAKRYGGRRAGTDALRDVSVDVPRGTVWAIAGANGAGKSTLLSLILGFVRPTAGRVSIEDDSPRGYLRDHGAGYLPERFGVPSGWRVSDTLGMLGRLDRASAADIARVVALFGLESHLAMRAADLSRGTLQRLGLAQAVLAMRDLLVLDEPTEGLDPIWRVRLRDILGELKTDRRTILIASHDLREVERVADRVLVLDDGRVREILDVGAAAEPARYRLTLAAPFDRIEQTFPGAERSGDRAYVVRVGGTAELSQRLGALIALGAEVAAVEPLRIDLEARVRDALGGDA